MPDLKNMEIGVMFWAGRDPLETIREVKALGVKCGQLGVPGNVAIDLASAAQWKNALDAEQFALVTVFAASCRFGNQHGLRHSFGCGIPNSVETISCKLTTGSSWRTVLLGITPVA